MISCRKDKSIHKKGMGNNHLKGCKICFRAIITPFFKRGALHKTPKDGVNHKSYMKLAPRAHKPMLFPNKGNTYF